MFDPSKLTLKAQEAMQAAQVKAVRYSHQELDAEHLLLTLLEQEDGLAPRLVERLGARPVELRARLEEELDRRPKIRGASTEAGKVYVTQRLNQLLVRASD